MSNHLPTVVPTNARISGCQVNYCSLPLYYNLDLISDWRLAFTRLLGEASFISDLIYFSAGSSWRINLKFGIMIAVPVAVAVRSNLKTKQSVDRATFDFKGSSNVCLSG